MSVVRCTVDVVASGPAGHIERLPSALSLGVLRYPLVSAAVVTHSARERSSRARLAGRIIHIGRLLS